MSHSLKKSGKFVLTSHAKERIRIRVGIDALEAQITWVNEAIAKAGEVVTQGNKHTVYKTDAFEFVCDGLRVITIQPAANEQTFVKQLGSTLAKEVRKLLAPQERMLRKAEIQVAELTLNFLKARNPKTKKLISERLIEATDEKQRISDEVFAIRKAAKQYGVEI